MKLNDKYQIPSSFDSLFKFESKEDEIEHEAKMIMFKILNTLEAIPAFKDLKKKDLAVLLGTSPSYITQLYKGDKIINLITLARLQDIFDVQFEISIKSIKMKKLKLEKI